MINLTSNKADAPNAAMTLRFQFEDLWCGAGDLRRWLDVRAKLLRQFMEKPWTPKKSVHVAKTSVVIEVELAGIHTGWESLSSFRRSARQPFPPA